MTKGIALGLKSSTLETSVMLLREGREKPIVTKELMVRFGWDSPDWEDWVRALYMTWIYGANSRDIARIVGCDKNTLIKLLEGVYGEDAVNPSAKSLLRSLAEDYPDDIVVEAFIFTRILVTEPSTGVEVTPYTCCHRGTKVKKLLVRNTYKTHRSNHSMDELSKAQCKGDRVLNYHRIQREDDIL